MCAQTLDGSFGAMLAVGAGGIVSLAIPAYGHRAGIMIFKFLIVSNPGIIRRILYAWNKYSERRAQRQECEPAHTLTMPSRLLYS